MFRLLFTALLAGCAAKAPVTHPGTQVATGTSAAPTAQTSDRPLLLWKVQKDQATSYLLGTCHLPIPLDHALSDPHKAALTDARVLYTELRMDQLGGMDALDPMWSEDSLKEQLGPDAWRATSLSLRKVMPAPALDHMPGWAAYSLISTFKDQDLFSKVTDAMSGKATGDVVPVLDIAVEQKAKELDLEHRALETAEQQFAVLNAHDDAFLDALKQFADGTSDDSQASAAMAQACFQGSISALEGAVQDEGDSDMMTALLDDRNTRWVANLSPEMAQGGVIVAAGAAHMIGPTGLIAAFESEGYTVTAQTGVGSDWEPPELELGSAGLEIPEVDPSIIDAHLANVDTLAAMACAPEGAVAQCMVPDAQTCLARMKTDLGLCIEQHAPDLPADPRLTPPELQMQLLGCAAAGVTMGAMVNDSFGDGPICQMMKAAMEQAQKAMSGAQ